MNDDTSTNDKDDEIATELPAGVLQAYKDAYDQAIVAGGTLDSQRTAGLKAALALAELLANPDTLPPYDERKRVEICDGYHAQAGETKHHLHDVYTTKGHLYGWPRLYVGSLMRSAVDDLAAASKPSPSLTFEEALKVMRFSRAIAGNMFELYAKRDNRPMAAYCRGIVSGYDVAISFLTSSIQGAPDIFDITTELDLA